MDVEVEFDIIFLDVLKHHFVDKKVDGRYSFARRSYTEDAFTKHIKGILYRLPMPLIVDLFNVIEYRDDGMQHSDTPTACAFYHHMGNELLVKLLLPVRSEFLKDFEKRDILRFFKAYDWSGYFES